MNTVGRFTEEEINGKPFHIYKFLSEEAIDFNGDDLLPPLFICQHFRRTFRWANRRNDDPNREDFLPVDVSHYPKIFNKRSGDEQFLFLIGSEIYEHPCKLPLSPLFWCNNYKEPEDTEFECGVCKHSNLGIGYYLCVECGDKFHKECVESPLEIKHSSYPFLSLKLYYPPEKDYSTRCSCCQTDIWEMFYYCPTYKLFLHPICAMKPIPIVIDHPKRHPHPLTFFPKQNSLACDVCGLVNKHFPTYVCARCVFVVHKDCVYAPYVIKISRHLHRISFTYSLPSGKLSCGVCRRKIDSNYGAYSCNKCDDYFVHTRCALRRDLWDGVELEGVPEEPEIVVEPPFKRISDGIILHFSHNHHLKLEICRVYDDDKFCQACVLPIYEDSYYSCMDHCDFILHESCANAPLKKQHAMHAHSLTLKVVTNEYVQNNDKGHFSCDACLHSSCGFVYEDPTDRRGFKLDLRCASVSEPFQYEGHEHPLFLALTPTEERSTICQICQEEDEVVTYFHRKLTCIECSFVICFACATLPYKAMYKHDKHFLTFREKEEASNDDDHLGWCDICESKIEYSRKGGFYSCDDYCSTTLHVHCLLGEYPYMMKPGQKLLIQLHGYHDERFHILRNNTLSRPFCHGCKKRCPHKVVYKMEDEAFKVLCSLYCVYTLKW